MNKNFATINIINKKFADIKIMSKKIMNKNFASKIFIMMILSITSIFVVCDEFHYHPITEEREVSNFTAVALDGAGDVRILIVDGNKRRAAVTADIDEIEHVTLAVDTNDILRVGAIGANGADDDGRIYIGNNENSGRVIIDAHTPTLNAISLSGVGNIRVSESVNASDHFAILHTGAGNVSAENFPAAAVTVIHTGVGNINVWAVDTLFVSITTQSGNVFYAGDPVVMMFDHLKLSEMVTDNVDRPNIGWTTDEREIGINTIDRPSQVVINSPGVVDPIEPPPPSDNVPSGIWLGNSDERVLPLR